MHIYLNILQNFNALEQFAGAEVAPAMQGIQTAVQDAITTAIAPLQDSIGHLHLHLMKASNKSAFHPTDPLSPLATVNEPLFPAALHDLRCLSTEGLFFTRKNVKE